MVRSGTSRLRHTERGGHTQEHGVGPGPGAFVQRRQRHAGPVQVQAPQRDGHRGQGEGGHGPVGPPQVPAEGPDPHGHEHVELRLHRQRPEVDQVERRLVAEAELPVGGEGQGQHGLQELFADGRAQDHRHHGLDDHEHHERRVQAPGPSTGEVATVDRPGAVHLPHQHGADQEPRQGQEHVHAQEAAGQRPVQVPVVEEDHVRGQHGQDGQAPQAVQFGVAAQRAWRLGRPSAAAAGHQGGGGPLHEPVGDRGQRGAARHHHDQRRGERGHELGQPPPLEPVGGDPLVPQVDAVGAERGTGGQAHQRRGGMPPVRRAGGGGGERAHRRQDERGGAHHEQGVAAQRLGPVEAGEHRRQVQGAGRQPQGPQADGVAGQAAHHGQRTGPARLQPQGEAASDRERVQVVGQPRQQRPPGVDRAPGGEVERVGGGHHTQSPHEGDQGPADQACGQPPDAGRPVTDAAGREEPPAAGEPQRDEGVEGQLGGQAPRLGDRPDGPARHVDVDQEHVGQQAADRGPGRDRGEQGDGQDHPVQGEHAGQPATGVRPELRQHVVGQDPTEVGPGHEQTGQDEEDRHPHVEPGQHVP